MSLQRQIALTTKIDCQFLKLNCKRNLLKFLRFFPFLFEDV